MKKLIVLFFTFFAFLIFTPKIILADYPILFFDDFSDGNLDGWNVAAGNWFIDNGNLVASQFGRALAGYIGQNSGSEWDNYIFEVDINNQNGVDEGINFRNNFNGSSYEITLRHGAGIYDTPMFILHQNQNNISKTLLLTKNLTLLNNQWYHLKIAANFESIKVWIDDRLIADINDTGTTVKKGSIGFTSWTGDVGIIKVRFDNVKITSLNPIPTKTPVIFIPGIGGSEFKSNATFISTIKDCGISSPPFPYGENNIVWVNKIMAATSVCDDYFDVLKLKTDGQTSEYPQIVLNDTIFQDSYGDLINFLQENNNYKLNETLFIFPYDWRKDISETSPLLNQLIETAKQKSGSQKVDIVAHSMGGLVAKNYIKDPAQATKVRKLITLGTPYLGSVKLLKALRYGDYFGPTFLFGLIGINPSETKDLIQNFPGTLELLPSEAYYEFYNNSDFEHQTPFRDDSDIDKNGVTGSLNFIQLQQLLTYFGHNMNLFNTADNFHNQLDKIWQNGTNNVETTLIVGSGKPTLMQIHEQNEIKIHFGAENGLQINKREEILANGDDTVPLFSASLTDGVKTIADLSNIFYVNQNHGNLTNRNSGPALQLVKNILANNTDVPAEVHTTPYKLNGKAIIIQSPVELNITDSNDNHTGPTTNGDFETNISGSYYDTLESTKMIWLPNDGQYDIKLNATDNGTFDLKIRSFDHDINNQTIIYKDIPITTATKAELNYDTTSQAPPSLNIDTDGNGTVDKVIGADAILEGNQVYDQQAPTTTIQLNGNQGNNGWYKSDVTVTLAATDEVNGSGILKTEYSLDNGQTVNKYTAPFTVSQEGITKIQVKSTDKAGNEEFPLKTTEIKIDKSTPIVNLSVNPKELWPVNKKLIDVLISGDASDNISGITSKTFTVSDEYQKLNPIISDFNQTIKLEAYRDGNDMDGRIYEVKVTAEDLAGNQGTVTTQVTVRHDQGKK